MHIAVVLSLCFHIAAYGRILSYSRSFSSQFFSLKNALFKQENLNGAAKLSYFKILNLSGFGIVKGGTRRPNGLLCKLHRNEIRKMHPHTLLIGLEKKIQYICYRNHRILKFVKNRDIFYIVFPLKKRNELFIRMKRSAAYLLLIY